MYDVKAALDRSITGDESQEAIEALVDDVLEPKLAELEEENRAARKRTLVKYGERYAREELNQVEGLEAFTLPAKVRRELEARLDGDEDEREVEERVDEILDEEVGEE
jgi:hypothetical protein